jgi:phthalate 4,5-dioxygenase oxygenase subunit
MLSQADNEILTRVDADMPMGRLVRQYWIPFLLASDLPEPDCDPLRVRLLGEDLIAFRDTTGCIGLLANHCPHRGASLFFGRNEEAGLRCVYHGWKFDVGGACVDMPNEPTESDFKDKIRARAYPCRERAGVIWTYMGPAKPLPPLPDLEWAVVPDDQRYVSVRLQECNWVQSLEGAIDASHSNFLHSPLKNKDAPPALFGDMNRGAVYRDRDPHPHFETLAHAHGVLVAARRDAEPDTYYWRINQFLMPFYTVFPPTGDDPPCSGHIWVPIDDNNTLVWHFTYHPRRPLTEPELHAMRYGRNGQDGFHAALNRFREPVAHAYGGLHPDRARSNDYLLDRQLQRTRQFFGVVGGWAQDAAVQESMGAIYTRWQEHLGSSDVGIIAVRRYLIDAAREFGAGAAAPGAADAQGYFARPAALLLARDASWADAARDALKGRLGESLVVV